MPEETPDPGGEVPPPSPSVIPADPSPYPVEAPGDEPFPPLRDPNVIDPGAPPPNPTNPPKPSF